MGNAGQRLDLRLRGRFGTAHLVAVAAGMVTALLLLAWTRGQEQLVSVVVAAGEIRAGTAVDAADLTLVEIPASASVAAAMVPAADLAALPGQVATRGIRPDEPILRSDLRPPVAEGGRRAMSIPLLPAQAVGGDLAVGDRVDVLVVTDDATRFVAEQVPVLALPAAASSGLVASPAGWWVTLGVEDGDALEIADGVEHGTVYLLRSTGTPALSVHELVPASDLPAEAAARGVGE